MPRYQRLGHICKKKGIQLYEFHFDYGLLQGDTTEVFVVKRPKKHKPKSVELNTEVLKG